MLTLNSPLIALELKYRTITYVRSSFFVTPTPTQMAFTGVTNAQRPSPHSVQVSNVKSYDHNRT